jgi:hypothetical protein
VGNEGGGEVEREEGVEVVRVGKSVEERNGVGCGEGERGSERESWVQMKGERG